MMAKRRTTLRVSALAGLTLLAGCATQPMPRPGADSDLGRAAVQPLRDLSVIRETAPDVLLRAAVAPYDLTHAGDCPSLQAELRALDDALGPDLTPNGKTTGVSVAGLAADLISGAVGLPFRGVVRWASGARSREAGLKAAILAGMVRRGFLKGRWGLMACDPA
ncbi:hypothetical protein [Phenylobacterium sp.]|uniref:hypothetical protein n=1 Tax=Phenylobacterium sp. TaxID=1871053 RepID=UPI00286DB482|nr:hypothetical protein [Phenylobacterium sp.]